MGCRQSRAAEGFEEVQQSKMQSLCSLEEAFSLEGRRLQATRDCRALDTAAEARFSTITTLLQDIFKVPIAVVGLIESDRLVLVSSAGTATKTCSRLHSFCDASLKLPRPTMMVVEDTLEDARFRHGPLVEGPPYVRFYAGAPLVSTEGYILGSLGIMDLTPRRFPADMYQIVINMAELVVRDLERDKAAELQRRQASCQLARALSCFNEAIALCDLTIPQDWRLLFANDCWNRLLGLPHDTSARAPFWDLLEPADHKNKEQQVAAVQAAIAQRQPFSLRALVMRSGGFQTAAPFCLSFRPAANDHISEPLVGIPSFVEATGGEYSAAHYFVTAKECIDGSPKSILSPLRSSCDGGPWRGSRGSSGSSSRSCFGLDRPEVLHDALQLGPLLGQGSYGKVYRGKFHGAHVAVKIVEMLVDPRVDPCAAGATSRGPLLEALLSRELSHPHIVQTHEFVSVLEQEEDESSRQSSISSPEDVVDTAPQPRQLQRVWIIQQYANYGTLYDAIDRGWLRTKRDLEGPTNLLAVLQTAQEIASAMSYLHARDIVHGDLTGNNVLLSSSTKDARRFTALVGDFGLARVLAGDGSIQTGTTGTVSHMPPETVLEGIVSKAGDVFAFGVLLWEMYCHERAWCGVRPSQIVFSVSQGLDLSMPTDAPPGYMELMRACLHRDRTQRPTFDEVLNTVDGLVAISRLAANGA